MKLLSKENFRQGLRTLVLVIASVVALILYLGSPVSPASASESSPDPVMDYTLMKAMGMGQNVLVIACFAQRMNMSFHTYFEKAVGIKPFTTEEKIRLMKIAIELEEKIGITDMPDMMDITKGDMDDMNKEVIAEERPRMLKAFKKLRAKCRKKRLKILDELEVERESERNGGRGK